MFQKSSTISTSTHNLRSNPSNLTSLDDSHKPESKTTNRRHSISDYRSILTSEVKEVNGRYTRSFSCPSPSENKHYTSASINQESSGQTISQPSNPVASQHSISSLDNTDVINFMENNNEVRNPSEWNYRMPLTPVGSIMFDDIESGVDTYSIPEEANDSNVTLPSMGSLDVFEESVHSTTEVVAISNTAKKIFLQNKINRIINDLIKKGIFGEKHQADQNIEDGTIYEFVTTSLKSAENPVNILNDRIKFELGVLSGLTEENDSTTIQEIIKKLGTEVSFNEIINSLSTNDEILSFLRSVIRDNVNQAVNNNDSYVGTEEFNQVKDLLLIYCLAISQITLDANTCKDIDISLPNPVSPNNPVWRTSFSKVIDKMLSPVAMIILHSVYWAITIATSIDEGHTTNNFPYENILGTFMAVYCAIAITHGSIMNSIRIYRSGQANPDSSKPLMYSSIFLNTFKDVTSLCGSVLSLINIPTYIPLFQASNLISSTLFAEALVYRAKEANKGEFNSQKLNLFSPLIIAPGLLLGASSIALPYCIPNICNNLFGYNGGDTWFVTHSLKSLVSNLLTASSDGYKEFDRIMILLALSSSFAVTSRMFVDIHRCEHTQLKKELQSFKGYLLFRYLVTVFTAVGSKADPYIPADEMAKKVGALYVFLSTCDTGKGIIWEPRVAEFNRKAIKSALRDHQISDLRNQFQKSVFNQLGEVNNVGDYLKIVIKATEEIGFSDKLEKMHTTDFEPDWSGVIDTVQSMLTVDRTLHNTKHSRSLAQAFQGHTEEDIPLLMITNSTSNNANTTDSNACYNESEDEILQKNNGRFTVVKVNDDEASYSMEKCDITAENLSSFDSLEQETLLSPEKTMINSSITTSNGLEFHVYSSSMPELNGNMGEYQRKSGATSNMFESYLAKDPRKTKSESNALETVINISDEEFSIL